MESGDITAPKDERNLESISGYTHGAWLRALCLGRRTVVGGRRLCLGRRLAVAGRLRLLLVQLPGNGHSAKDDQPDNDDDDYFSGACSARATSFSMFDVRNSMFVIRYS